MTTIGRHYNLESELEPVANGYVAHGVDDRTGNKVFVKQFDRYVMPSKESLCSGSTSASARRDRFVAYERRLKEVDRRLMRVCASSATLVRPVELVRNANKLVHVTELVDTSRVVPSREVHSRYTRDQVVSMFKGVLSTVGAIHGQGVVLVDVKDDNMFAIDTPDGLQARVFDYDDAVIEGDVPNASELVGTPEWYSPELALYTMHSEPGDDLGTSTSPLARVIGRAHDIFALGLVLHVYLTGELPGQRHADSGPASGGRGAESTGAQAPWQAIMRGTSPVSMISPALEVNDRIIIAKMLSRNPTERPSSCAEVLSWFSSHETASARARRVAEMAAAAVSPARPCRPPKGAGSPATAWPPRKAVSTEGDDIVFDGPRGPLGVLSVSALAGGKVRIRLADGRALEKRPYELGLYGLDDVVAPVTDVAHARFGAYW